MSVPLDDPIASLAASFLRGVFAASSDQQMAKRMSLQFLRDAWCVERGYAAGIKKQDQKCDFEAAVGGVEEVLLAMRPVVGAGSPINISQAKLWLRENGHARVASMLSRLPKVRNARPHALHVQLLGEIALIRKPPFELEHKDTETKAATDFEVLAQFEQKPLSKDLSSSEGAAVEQGTEKEIRCDEIKQAKQEGIVKKATDEGNFDFDGERPTACRFRRGQAG